MVEKMFILLKNMMVRFFTKKVVKSYCVQWFSHWVLSFYFSVLFGYAQVGMGSFNVV